MKYNLSIYNEGYIIENDKTESDEFLYVSALLEKQRIAKKEADMIRRKAPHVASIRHL